MSRPGPADIAGGSAGAADASTVASDPARAEGYRVLRSRADLSGLPPLTRAVTESVVCATADFGYITDLVCDEAILAAGVRAIAAGTPVVADAPTVAALQITGHPVIPAATAGASATTGAPAAMARTPAARIASSHTRSVM